MKVARRAPGAGVRKPPRVETADRPVGRERALAPSSVVDDRPRIGHAERYPGTGEFERGRAPWLVDQACRQARKLGHPAPDIKTAMLSSVLHVLRPSP